jgi:hypothetical protein
LAIVQINHAGDGPNAGGWSSPKKGLAVVKRLKKVKVRVTVRAFNSAGASKTTTATITLRAPKS